MRPSRQRVTPLKMLRRPSDAKPGARVAVGVVPPAANPVGILPHQIDRRASTEVFMSRSTCSHVRGLLFLSCRILKWIREVGGVVLLYSAFAPALAQPSNGPPIAREIERRFEGFYLF